MKYKTCLLFLLLFISIQSFSQSIHYYGWDTTYSHWPTDIIRTQDGGILIIGDVNSSEPLFENYISRVFLVRTDSVGDTLWTRYYFHPSYGNENVIETNTGEFKTLGGIDGGYICNVTFQRCAYESKIANNIEELVSGGLVL